MTSDTQQDLFGPVETVAVPITELFAEIVFDRPLDDVYTYGVPEELRAGMAVGKRVEVPFGRGDRATIGFCVGLTETPPQRTVKMLQRVVDDEPLLTENLLRLTRWMADYYLCGWGQVLNTAIPAGAKDRAGTRKTSFVEPMPEAERPTPEPELTTKQREVWQRLLQIGQAVEVRQLTRLIHCGPGPVEALLHKGLARRVVRRVDRFADSSEEIAVPEGPLTLSEDQQQAWSVLEPALKQGGFKAFLLHGVTGSGKTELYLKAIEETIKQGKEALVLVPEISLTPQTIAQFQGRCKDVAVLHSHLGDAERGGHWRRVAAGHMQVVVGARSAVFAPARKLGLIVIDEEHEHTFKQESTPRYHGRDVAVMRARLENIPILLGSATPSLESWHNAQRGQYTLLTLPKRVLDRPLPHVGLIDMRHEGSHPGRFRALSDNLESAMRESLKQGGQVMLLLNRRGYSTHIHCPACGHVEQCRFCDLALTYHRERDVMLCHYCGYESEPPGRCPACGLGQVRYQGLGTEKLQAEIEERFPGFVVRRMDSDTMRKPGSHGRVLAAFRRGLIHILLGTQMIAKGLDFPNVTLVGVVNADVGLHVPDFRASERTFQLLSQVAGRTGRGPRGGRVLVQTYTPDHPAVALAGTHDYATFVAAEMLARRAHNYPPFQRLVRLIVRGKDQQETGDFSERMAAAFQEALKRRGEAASVIRLLGPAEAPVFRLKDYYRYHFQLQSSSPGELHRLIREVRPTLRPPSGVEVALDVDPYNML
jgi:primosomal protein N' (replication factor Y) (superfamily II helicase)